MVWSKERESRECWSMTRFVVTASAADQGVALVIVMPVVPRGDQRRYVTKRDLRKFGYTDERQACTQLAAGMHNVKVPHHGRCRDRIGELVAEHEDQRQYDRVSSRAVPEAEVLRPEGGEDMDVSSPTVHVSEPTTRPTLTYKECRSSSSSSRANEMNTVERILKREVRGKPRPEEVRRRGGRAGGERGRTTTRR